MESLPTYKQLKQNYPSNSHQLNFIQNCRKTISDILAGKDPRILLIVGPCSIHDKESTLEFAIKLKEFIPSVSSQFFVIMRVYPEKARTSEGWKGLLYDPHLDGTHDIKTGLSWTRQLLLQLASLQIPSATEFLDPLTAFYYEDLISWGSIGARTCSSQPHRQFASGLNMPIGIKNGVAGNINAAINGVLSASQPHTYLGLDENGLPSIIKTDGNPNTHVVLRGGDKGPNFDLFSVHDTIERLTQASLPTRLMIDCSHQNSGKRYDKQPFVFESIIDQILEGNHSIRGIMLESHLYSGHQPLLQPLKYGVSITDPCLDWIETEKLLHQGALQLSNHLYQPLVKILHLG